MDEAKFLVKMSQGIPYAKPPIGNLRFMPPEPFGKWHGIRPAKKPGSDCIHKTTFNENILGSEDCLYLNVYTPQAPSEITTLKAVVVEIHSGGMTWGSGSPEYFGGPDFIMNHDVIFVTFNYRLHIFGFLNLELPNCAGNMGMKDIILALQWVQNNIKYFGGDPDNVTLYGNSSSASAIHMLMMSPMSKGLFHKSVMQGGYAINALWSYMEDHLERAFELAKYLEFKGNNTKRLLRFMKQLSPETIIGGLEKLRKDLKSNITGRLYNSVFMTSIEVIPEGAFLTQSPRDLLYSVESKPILWSVANAEGIHALVGNPWDLQLRNIVKEYLWMYKISDKTLDILVEKVQSYYFGEHDHGRDTIVQIIDLFSDMWYNEWYDVIDYHASIPNAHPEYVFCFSFVGTLNLQRNFFTKHGIAAPQDLGASHADDSPYVIHYKIFHSSIALRQHLTKRERKAIDNMCKIVTNFAKNSNPSGGLSENIDWKPYNKDNPEYLEFGENLQIKKGIIHGKRTKFWRELTDFIKANEKDAALIDDVANMRINEQPT